MAAYDHIPSKHKAVTQCYFNVGPTSSRRANMEAALGQHWGNARYIVPGELTYVLAALDDLIHMYMI